jgi:hypothetical protein
MIDLIKRFMPANFNDLLAFLYFPFVLVWVIMLALIYIYFDVGIIESLGLGTATGVILSKFSDIYQFYFRRAPDLPVTTETKTTSSSVSTSTTPDDIKGDKV